MEARACAGEQRPLQNQQERLRQPCKLQIPDVWFDEAQPGGASRSW